MSALSALVYVLDAWILGTYALLAKRGKVRPFHWANAIGGVPTVTFEVLVHAWPVIPLTGTFCVLGWVGVWSTRRRKPIYVTGSLKSFEDYSTGPDCADLFGFED